MRGAGRSRSFLPDGGRHDPRLVALLQRLVDHRASTFPRRARLFSHWPGYHKHGLNAGERFFQRRFSHLRLRPLLQKLPSRFDTMPSGPSSHALANTIPPSAGSTSLNTVPPTPATTRGAPCRSAYGSFLAHSARTESNWGTRALGRFDPFASCRGNGRFLRIGVVQCVVFA